LQIGNDTAKVGYFKTSLQSGVQVELSASRHAGIIHYSFPSGEKHILVDVSHVSVIQALVWEYSINLLDISIFPAHLETPLLNFTSQANLNWDRTGNHIKDMVHTLEAGITVRSC
jgi:putative alpha-1,2-mannosidase